MKNPFNEYLLTLRQVGRNEFAIVSFTRVRTPSGSSWPILDKQHRLRVADSRPVNVVCLQEAFKRLPNPNQTIPEGPLQNMPKHREGDTLQVQVQTRLEMLNDELPIHAQAPVQETYPVETYLFQAMVYCQGRSRWLEWGFVGRA